MTGGRFIPSCARRLAQPHRPNSLARNDATSRAGNSQSGVSRVDQRQSGTSNAWSTTFKDKIRVSVKGKDQTGNALSP